jgi:hypothetical protein
MNFFKKIFSGQESTLNKIGNSSIQDISRIKRNIFDFFQLDLKQIPDESFIKAERETNISGESVQNFRKSLDYKECGIFDTVEVLVIGDNSKNIIFKSFQPQSIKIEHLRKLIDELYLIHGNDSSDKGKFTSKDIEEYRDTEFNCLFGRSWSDYPKYEHPISIGRDDNVVSLTIWGLNLNVD